MPKFFILSTIQLKDNYESGTITCWTSGTGGLGSELLRDLALSGFKSIQVIDMDTIETSNLSHHSLFRSRGFIICGGLPLFVVASGCWEVQGRSSS
ncbi:unnamed protein product [Musa acuminata var. zebrina]